MNQMQTNLILIVKFKQNTLEIKRFCFKSTYYKVPLPYAMPDETGFTDTQAATYGCLV